MLCQHQPELYLPSVFSKFSRRAGQSARYNRLSPGERREILEILIATKPDLPDEWKRLGTAPDAK